MTNHPPIRVGIIGLGAVGQWMLQQFLAEPTVVVHAVCDINQDRAVETASRLGRVSWSTDYRVVLAADQIDLVYVAVPPRDHYRVVLDSLAARKHVLCEKPLALSLSEAQEMAAEARRAGVLHAINLPGHYAPGMRVFGEQIAAGVLGELRRIEIVLIFPEWPRPWQLNHWVASREQGGPIREVAPHLFEVLLRYFGPIRRIWAYMEYPPDPTACERAAVGLLELSGGACVTVSALCNLPRPETITFTAYGSAGTLGLEGRMSPMRADVEGRLVPIPLPEAATPSLIQNVVRAVRGEPADVCNFDNGLAIQALLDGWERAARSGEWTDVHG